ncbi:MAG: NUDIX domain-containing protein, partial [Asgard group archaeon]|nr:NUDIX domain-containing protein [Asgard group archaeon]
KDRTLYWRLVKGGVKNSETDKEAIKREIIEETGFHNVQIKRKINEYSYYFPEDKKHIVHVYLVNADMREKIGPTDESEGIVEVKWFDPKEAEKLVHYDEEKDSLKKAFGL